MDRSEQTLAPEWLKASGSSSSLSDEHNSGTLSRNILAASACDHDPPRASTSSFRRSASSNGSMGHDKDGFSRSQAYSSFGRSRDRDRDRQRVREKVKLLDNRYNEFCDSLMARRIEETLRRSQSMVSGRRVEMLPKRLGNGSSNGVLSAGSSSGGLSKVSFERDFPSLGAEEKQGASEVVRLPSPGIGTALSSLHISTSAIIGADGWTSALAEVPAVGVGSGTSMPSSLQSTANTSSTASSSATGSLSMAETLAQAPSRSRTAPLLSNDSERRKELTLMQQYNKLIPVTPQGPKNVVLNSTEKLKPKGSRNGDLVGPKVGQQPSTLLVKTAASQSGNFLVLNREKNNGNGASCPTTTKDEPPAPLTTAATRVQSASAPHLKLKVNNGMVGEKKSLIISLSANQKLKANGGMAQDRNDFFNSLRKKAEMKNGMSHHDHHTELSCSASSSSASCASNSMLKPDEQTIGKNILSPSNSGLSECAVTENGEPDVVVAPDEKEKAFLESLGWNESYAGDEEALTAEEIESFLKKHEEKLGPDFKYKAGLSGSYSSGLSLSSS